MGSMYNINAEELAKLFHHYHQALTNDFHGQASKEADSSWDQAPTSERRLMIAAARLTLLELAANSAQGKNDYRYFAKPGEANWGC